MDVGADLVAGGSGGGAEAGDHVRGAEQRALMAATATAGTRATVPRQPAWTQARTPATGSCRTIGTQSAVRMASTTPGVVVTSASASAIASSRVNAPPPRSVSPTVRRRPVDLAGEREVCGAGPEGGREPTPVLQDPGWIVADAQAQVQRRVRPGRDPAAAGRDGRVRSGGVRAGQVSRLSPPIARSPAGAALSAGPLVAAGAGSGSASAASAAILAAPGPPEPSPARGRAESGDAAADSAARRSAGGCRRPGRGSLPRSSPW